MRTRRFAVINKAEGEWKTGSVPDAYSWLRICFPAPVTQPTRKELHRALHIAEHKGRLEQTLQRLARDGWIELKEGKLGDVHILITGMPAELTETGEKQERGEEYISNSLYLRWRQGQKNELKRDHEFTAREWANWHNLVDEYTAESLLLMIEKYWAHGSEFRRWSNLDEFYKKSAQLMQDVTEAERADAYDRLKVKPPRVYTTRERWLEFAERAEATGDEEGLAYWRARLEKGEDDDSDA